MPSWQSTSRIGCPIDNPARRSRGAAPSTRPQWTRVPLDFRPRWRYVVNKAGAANAAPALKYKFYFTPHFCGYTEFGMVPMLLIFNLRAKFNQLAFPVFDLRYLSDFRTSKPQFQPKNVLVYDDIMPFLKLIRFIINRECTAFRLILDCP